MSDRYYELLGRGHAAAHHAGRQAALALREERGQGTVEYVGLILLMAGVMATVVAVAAKSHVLDQLPKKIADQLNNAIGKVGK